MHGFNLQHILHILEAIGLLRPSKVPRIFLGGQSTDHGVVVIDTVAVPGIPATRWVYATRPVFLSMDPAQPCSSYRCCFSGELRRQDEFVRSCYPQWSSVQGLGCEKPSNKTMGVSFWSSPMMHAQSKHHWEWPKFESTTPQIVILYNAPLTSTHPVATDSDCWPRLRGFPERPWFLASC